VPSILPLLFHFLPLSRIFQEIMLGFSWPALLACLTVAETAASQTFQSQQHDLPYPANDSLATIFGSNDIITIKGGTTSPGVVVLDYGANVEGHPTFQVISAIGDTSGLEITYSESKSVLENFYMVRI
jgi:hypothetical protein